MIIICFRYSPISRLIDGNDTLTTVVQFGKKFIASGENHWTSHMDSMMDHQLDFIEVEVAELLGNLI